MLSKNDNELESAIPNISAGGDANIPAVQRLKQLLQQVELIKSERQQVEDELKEPAAFDMTDTFTRALAESGAMHEEELSVRKLNDMFTPIRERITSSIQQQEKVMADVMSANSEFVAAKGPAGAGGARQQFLTQLTSANDAFQELEAHLDEGTKFYNDLTPLLVRLQQKVSDFCFARRTEKEELMRDLQQAIVSQPTEAPKSTPPSRPPPPKAQAAPMAPPAVAPQQQAAAPPPGQTPYQSQPYNPYAQPQAGAPAAPGYPPQQQNPYGAPQQAPYQPYPNQGGYPPQQQQPGGYPSYPTWPGSQPQYGYPSYPPQGPMPPGYNPYAQQTQQHQQQYGGYPPQQQQQQQPPPPNPNAPYPTQQWAPR